MIGKFMCWHEAVEIVSSVERLTHLAMGGTDTYLLETKGKQQIIILDAASQKAITYEGTFRE